MKNPPRRNKIKRLVISLAAGSVLIAGFFYLSLNTPWLTRILGKYIISKAYPQGNIQSLTIADQNFYFPGRLRLDNIQAVFKTKEGRQTFHVRQCVIDSLDQYFSRGVLSFDVKGVRFLSENLKVSEMFIRLNGMVTDGQFNIQSGDIQLAEIDLSNFKITNLFSMIDGQGAKVRLRDLYAQVYSGKLSGEATVWMNPATEYLVELNVSRLSLQKLSDYNSAVFSQVDGDFDGHITAAGQKGVLKELALTGEVLAGGKISASLLQFLFEYFPQSAQKKQFQSLLKSGGKVEMDKILLNLKTINDEKFSGEIRMSSRQLNVDVSLPIDINFEDGINSLFSFTQK